jgi:hypothetical protein
LEIGGLQRKELGAVDVLHSLVYQLLNQVIVVLQEVRLMVVVKSLLQIELQVVRITEGNERLWVLGVKLQAALVSFNSIVPFL